MAWDGELTVQKQCLFGSQNPSLYPTDYFFGTGCVKAWPLCILFIARFTIPFPPQNKLFLSLILNVIHRFHRTYYNNNYLYN
jgi:hypothetical protein